MAGDPHIKEALESTETKATVIRAILEKEYGEQVFDWEPETVGLEVYDDFGAEMSSESANRWSAMQTAMTTDVFFKRVDGFFSIASSLAIGEPFFSVFNPLETEKAGWAIAEMSLNREMLSFGPSVKRYIRVKLEDSGYAVIPDVLKPIFGDEPDEIARETIDIPGTENVDLMEQYIADELADMEYQFSRIPHLKHVDNALLQGESLVDSL